MAFKNHRSKPDQNFSEVVRCLKDRLGGYWKDPQYPTHHHAHLRGLDVVAYDLNKVGSGFPDAEIWVSWFCIQFEIKAERVIKPEQNNPGQFKVQMTDEEYYRAQLEPSEVFYRMHHPGVYVIAHDRNEIYEWLNAAADFVFFCEGQAERTGELLRLFFPRAVQEEKSL